MPDTGIEVAVPFQFELSWRSLSHLEEQPLPRPNSAIATSKDSSRNWTLPALFVVLLALLAFAAVRRMQQPSSAPFETLAVTEVGAAGWIAEPLPDAARQISLYRPTVSMSDYRLEFSGRLERQSLGWVFRRTDPGNYYVGKLQASGSGASVTLIRYGVVQGVEDPPIQIPLPNVSGGELLKVKLDAKGSRFTIYVQDQVVAAWDDDRLKTGGVGFLTKKDERAQVESVLISF